MRKILDGISFVLLALQFLMTVSAVYGRNPLPDRFPTHLDVVGNPDKWGTTSSLQVLPFVSLVLYFFVTVVAEFALSGKAKKKSIDEATGEEIPLAPSPLEELTQNLIAWIKTEMTAIFTCLQVTLLEAAWHPDQGSTLLGVWLLLVAVVATIAWYVAAMVRAMRLQM